MSPVRLRYVARKSDEETGDRQKREAPPDAPAGWNRPAYRRGPCDRFRVESRAPRKSPAALS